MSAPPDTPRERWRDSDHRHDGSGLESRLRHLAARNQQLFEELRQGERRLRRLCRAVWQVQEDEHRRLARELHDGVGQLLVALKSRLEPLARGGEASEVTEAAAACARIAGEALEQTRELSRLLRPTVLDDLGLLAALRWLARTLRERSGLEVDLWSSGLEERLDPELETLVFRVVQEALTNVLKHAGVREAEVELAANDHELRLVVQDRGRGFDPTQVLDDQREGRAVGLRGIQDRVALFDGTVRLESAPGAGVRLEVVVPREETR